MLRLIAREIKGAWDQISPIHVSKFPAYLGHTVYRSEYDALKEECDREHKAAQDWYENYTICYEEGVKLQNRVNVCEGAIAEDLLTIDTLQKQLEETELLRKNAFAAYDQQVEKNTELKRVHKIEIDNEIAQSTALQKALDEQTEVIWKQRDEIEKLQNAIARRKPKPRETGVRP